MLLVSSGIFYSQTPSNRYYIIAKKVFQVQNSVNDRS